MRHVTLRTAMGMLFSGSLHSPAARPMISVPWKFTRMMTIVRTIAHQPFGAKPPFERRMRAPMKPSPPKRPRQMSAATTLKATSAKIFTRESQNSLSPNLSTRKRFRTVTTRPKNTAHHSWLTSGTKLFMMMPAAIISDGTYAIQLSQYAQPTPHAHVEEMFSRAYATKEPETGFATASSARESMTQSTMTPPKRYAKIAAGPAFSSTYPVPRK